MNVLAYDSSSRPDQLLHQARWKILYRSLEEDSVSRLSRAGLRSILSDSFPRVRIDTDVEPLRVSASATVCESTVAGSKIDDDPIAVAIDKLPEVKFVKSSNGSATNQYQHHNLPFQRQMIGVRLR